VQNGTISKERIDDACHRILKAKFAAGIFEEPIAPESLLQDVGSFIHRSLAREAVQQSVVVLQNKHDMLPLKKGGRFCVAGRAGNDLGMQLGGWSVHWQGQDPETPEAEQNKFTKGTTLFEAVSSRFPGSIYDRTGVCTGFTNVIAVIGETPYAESYGDRTHMAMHSTDMEMLKNARQGYSKTVMLVVMSGRPLNIDDALEQVSAAVAAFVPGSEGGLGILDVLDGTAPPTGKLSVDWPTKFATLPLPEDPQQKALMTLFPYGFGLDYRGKQLPAKDV
jgi:beta-glucosidase